MSPAITCGIYLYNTVNRKILACHATNSPWNRWSIPKGLKEPGEKSFDAAARELLEETGVDIHQLNILATHTLPPVKYLKQNKILESFLVITDSDLTNTRFVCTTLINHAFPEVDSWKWISLDAVPKYLHESQQKNVEFIVSLLV